ncbi:MAG TPA: TolC family protein [Candidatus Paceibacterota bacterium]|nr:TolC family protein [Verrucomicrobiota bacterium]HRY49749.1 TolC family protein [Candidatus Paceibacterota bacterium]
MIQRQNLRGMRIGSLACVAAVIFLSDVVRGAGVAAVREVIEQNEREANLEECLETAFQNNRRRPASRFAVAMAEAQHRQALAGYWPQIGLKGGYQRLDEAPNFLFPASTFSVPAQNIAIPMGGSIPVTVPGVGTIPVSSFPVPAQSIRIPAQDVRLMDPDNLSASLNADWLLYDGGMRRGHREQAAGWVEMMKQESHQTDLEIADSVRRFYYGSVLARQLQQVGQDTLARMEATLNLTETMYKEGGGKVKRTDWLENKVMVESLRSMVALLEKNEKMARSALANTMGLSWDTTVRPADKETPFAPFIDRLDGLVSAAYRFNPDWNKLEAGIRAAEGAVRTAKSGHYPKLAVTGELRKWWNDDSAGMATDRNKEGWTVGVGMEIPLFSGFLVKNKVAETRAQVAKLKEEQFLIKEGLAIQIKDTFLGLSAAEKSHQATLEAMNAAVESRDLNTRAYQNELVETEKVIRAQLMEALMSAQHYKVRYDHIALQSQLNLLVGTEVLKKLESR